MNLYMVTHTRSINSKKVKVRDPSRVLWAITLPAVQRFYGLVKLAQSLRLCFPNKYTSLDLARKATAPNSGSGTQEANASAQVLDFSLDSARSTSFSSCSAGSVITLKTWGAASLELEFRERGKENPHYASDLTHLEAL